MGKQDKDVVRKTIRTLVLDRRNVMVWIGWSWLMIVLSGGHFCKIMIFRGRIEVLMAERTLILKVG